MKVIPLAYPVRLLLAVLGHLTLYVVGANVAWLLRIPEPARLGPVAGTPPLGPPAGRTASRHGLAEGDGFSGVDLARQWSRRLRLGELLRLTYYLVAPYVVLYWGWASPLDLGLADLDWIGGIGTTVALGAVSLLLLAWLWWQHAKTTEDPLAVQQVQWLEQPWGWVIVLREVIFLEAWWALCRSPMLVLAGPYFGVYWGLALVLAAALLNARTWHELRTPGYREGVLLTGSLAMVTGTLYVFTHNLWLCVALHSFLRLAVLQLLQRRLA